MSDPNTVEPARAAIRIENSPLGIRKAEARRQLCSSLSPRDATRATNTFPAIPKTASTRASGSCDNTATGVIDSPKKMKNTAAKMSRNGASRARTD